MIRIQKFHTKTVLILSFLMFEKCRISWELPLNQRSPNSYGSAEFTKMYTRFLNEYQNKGINFWCITTGNEPMNGLLVTNKLNAVGWTPTSQRKWIGQYLGPEMNATHPGVCILTADDQRYVFPWWLKTVRKVSTALNCAGSSLRLTKIKGFKGTKKGPKLAKVRPQGINERPAGNKFVRVAVPRASTTLF